MNEPRVENDFSGDILTDWIAEMSAYAKTLDKNHLVMTGCEGFYADRTKYDWKLNGAKGGDFIRNHAVKTVDIASCHIWPGSSDYCLTAEGVVEWLKLHIEDARKLGKPLILGEYGEIRGFNGDTVERDRLFSLVLDLAEKEGMAGTNFWVLLHNDYRQYDDGYGVYYPEDKSTVRIIKAAAKKSKRGGSAGWKFPPLFFR
jgi:mannan endo-1,4-beta-mannosidase